MWLAFGLTLAHPEGRMTPNLAPNLDQKIPRTISLESPTVYMPREVQNGCSTQFFALGYVAMWPSGKLRLSRRRTHCAPQTLRFRVSPDVVCHVWQSGRLKWRSGSRAEVAAGVPGMSLLRGRSQSHWLDADGQFQMVQCTAARTA